MLFMKVIPTPDPTSTPNPRIVQKESSLKVRAQRATPATWRLVEIRPTCLEDILCDEIPPGKKKDGDMGAIFVFDRVTRNSPTLAKMMVFSNL